MKNKFKIGMIGDVKNEAIPQVVFLSILANIEKYNGKIINFEELGEHTICFTVKGRKVFNNTIKQFKKNGWNILRVKDMWFVDC